MDKEHLQDDFNFKDTKSKYIVLPESHGKLRHWIGYRKGYDVSKADDEKLFLFTSSLEKPRILKIPDNLIAKYHIDNFYFKISEQRLGIPEAFGHVHGICERWLNSELLYSESYKAANEEIIKRGLTGKLNEWKEQRKKEFLSGKGITVLLDDFVVDPEFQKYWEDVQRFNEASEKSLREDGHPIIDNSIRKSIRARITV